MLTNQNLLLQCIVALYYNSITADKSIDFISEIESILSELINTNTGTSVNIEDDIIKDGLQQMAVWMVNGDIKEYEFELIKAKLCGIVQQKDDYITTVDMYLVDSITPEDAKKKCIGILNDLKYHRNNNKLKLLIKKANADINFSGKYVNSKEFTSHLMNELTVISSKLTNEQNGLVGKVSFTDEDSIEKVLLESKNSCSERGLLNTGLIGFNNMLGGGIPRGYYVKTAALSGRYKSHLLCDLAMNVPHHNVPYMLDDTKRPLILMISFENTLRQYVNIFYKKLFEIKNGERCNMAKVNETLAKKELKAHFGVNGYNFELEYYLHNNFTVFNLIDVIERYIKLGYEIHMLIIDFAAMIANNTMGERLELKHTRTIDILRGYCASIGIAVADAHQLNSEAQRQAADYKGMEFTKRVSGGGYYKECTTLTTALDVALFTDVFTHVDGNKYLALGKGKHRDGETIPDSLCHCLYKFQQFGGITPDYGQEDLAMYKLPSVSDVSDMVVDW